MPFKAPNKKRIGVYTETLTFLDRGLYSHLSLADRGLSIGVYPWAIGARGRVLGVSVHDVPI